MCANISDRNGHVGRHVLFSNDHPCSSSNISITWVTSLASSISHTCAASQYMTVYIRERSRHDSLHKRVLKAILLKNTTLTISDYSFLSIVPFKERLNYNKGVLIHQIMYIYFLASFDGLIGDWQRLQKCKQTVGRSSARC